MSFFIKKEEGERVMCKCQNQKTEWIIAIIDIVNNPVNMFFFFIKSPSSLIDSN